MANNFAGDANCVAWWQFEPDALLIDTMGLNHIGHNSGVTVDSTIPWEGLGCAYKTALASRLYLEDAELSAAFPLKSGDATKQISLCFGVYINAFAWDGTAPLVQKGFSAGDISFRIRATATYWRLSTAIDGSFWEDHDLTETVHAGRWYHVGVTYRDDTKAYRLRVYDSVTGGVSELADTGTNPIVVDNGTLYLGYGSTAWSHTAHCRFDEMVVFNDILTAGEIDQIRSGTYSMPLPNAGDPIADTVFVPASPPTPTIAAWCWRAAYPIREKLEFKTEIIQPHDRVTEQRIAKRLGIPRQIVTLPYWFRDDSEAARLDALLHVHKADAWPIPLWYEAEPHPGAIAAGAGSIAIDTRYADFRDNSYAMIYQRDVAAEIVTVASVADDALTLDGVTVNAYGGPCWVMPCRYGWIRQPTQKRRHVGQPTFVDMTCSVYDIAAVTGWTAPMTYDSLDVLTDPSWLQGRTHDEDVDPDTAWLDSGNGLYEVVSNSDYHEVTQPHVWHWQTKAQAWAVRQFLHNKKGMQGAFLVPTFHDDIGLSRAYSGGATVYVASRGFVGMDANTLRQYVAFRPSGGSIIVRKVTGCATVSATEEALTIAAAASGGYPAGSALCWVDKCRLGNDDVTFNWRARGKGSCMVDLVRIT